MTVRVTRRSLGRFLILSIGGVATMLGAIIGFLWTAAPASAQFNDQITIMKSWDGPDPGLPTTFMITGNDPSCTITTATILAGQSSVVVPVTEIGGGGSTPINCTYTVSENSVTGYILPPAQDADPGDVITFVNTPTTQSTPITINKTWVPSNPDDTAVVFTVTPSVQDCTATQMVTLPAGAASVDATVAANPSGSPTVDCVYTITEATPPGWISTPASNTAMAGESVSFTNTRIPNTNAMITIEKTWVGVDPNIDVVFTVTPDVANCTPSQDVTLPAGSSSVNATVVDLTSSLTGGLTDCTYSVAEPTIPGYTSSGDQTGVAIDGIASFVNTQNVGTTSITVNKTWSPTDPGIAVVFEITPEVTGCGLFLQETLPANASSVIISVPDVAVGSAATCTYTVSEVTPSGYTSSPSSVSSVGPGDSADFTNTLIPVPGTTTITVNKTWSPSDPGIAVVFTITPEVSGCGSAFDATLPANIAGMAVSVPDIATGNGATCSYTVTEATPTGYTSKPASVTSVGAGDSADFTNTLIDTTSPVILINDPYQCGGDFTGTVSGGTAPYSIVHTVTPTAGGATTILGPVMIAAAGPFVQPITSAAILGDQTVVAMVTDATGVSTSSAFTAFVRNNCTDPPGEAILEIPHPGGPLPDPDPIPQPSPTSPPDEVKPVVISAPPRDGSSLAVTGSTTQLLAAFGLLLAGAGSLFVGSAHRRRNERELDESPVEADLYPSSAWDPERIAALAAALPPGTAFADALAQPADEAPLRPPGEIMDELRELIDEHGTEIEREFLAELNQFIADLADQPARRNETD